MHSPHAPKIGVVACGAVLETLAKAPGRYNDLASLRFDHDKIMRARTEPLRGPRSSRSQTRVSGNPRRVWSRIREIGL